MVLNVVVVSNVVLNDVIVLLDVIVERVSIVVLDVSKVVVVL